MANKTPPGVVLVFVDEKGNPVANTADFNKSGYGGCTLQQSQAMRARRDLAIKVCSAYASPYLVRGIDDAESRQIMDRLVRQHGCKIVEVLIGEDVR